MLVAILVVVILILLVGGGVWWYMMASPEEKQQAESGATTAAATVSAPVAENISVKGSNSMYTTNAKQVSQHADYEAMANSAMNENMEFYTSCENNGVSKNLLDCVCGDDDRFEFGHWPYGSDKMQSYSDFVASQAVDDKVVANHVQFVRDRRGLGPEGEFITGRTYSPDSHDSYDPVPWAGIRGRHKTGKTDILCGGRGVPDMDTNLFKGNRPFCLYT